MVTSILYSIIEKKNHLVNHIISIFILSLTYNYILNLDLVKVKNKMFFIYENLLFIYFVCKNREQF